MGEYSMQLRIMAAKLAAYCRLQNKCLWNQEMSRKSNKIGNILQLDVMWIKQYQYQPASLPWNWMLFLRSTNVKSKAKVFHIRESRAIVLTVDSELQLQIGNCWSNWVVCSAVVCSMLVSLDFVQWQNGWIYHLFGILVPAISAGGKAFGSAHLIIGTFSLIQLHWWVRIELNFIWCIWGSNKSLLPRHISHRWCKGT